MIDLSPAQSTTLLERVLTSPESRTLDVKRVSGKMVQKALETLCAFANTDGGVLALGIDDPAKAKGAQRIYGVQENPEAVDELQRKVLTQFNPPISGIRFMRLACTLRSEQAGHVVLVQVGKSQLVHSIVDNGTWTRLDASNREMSAPAIADLAYQRGVRSAASELVPVNLGLLDTPTWHAFVAARGLKTGTMAEQLQRIGLADTVAGELRPTRAAVLLFAHEPGSLLAAYDSRG
ncbi:ATP-binding protein [Polaromonas sp. P1(28)-13]|nr:ATP-binding protein [Polaromonas sp. P1(28)-13]